MPRDETQFQLSIRYHNNGPDEKVNKLLLEITLEIKTR